MPKPTYGIDQPNAAVVPFQGLLTVTVLRTDDPGRHTTLRGTQSSHDRFRSTDGLRLSVLVFYKFGALKLQAYGGFDRGNCTTGEVHFFV